MSTGSAEWARTKRELLAQLELEPGAGRERMRALAEESPELAAEVAELLAGARAPEGFLELPALERAAEARESRGGSPAPPARIGPWRLEEEIGYGGMGTVWRARRDDVAGEQLAAVKLVRPELATDPLRRRLVAERSILAGLAHAGIARLLDGGVTGDGVPYLVLEHVDGQPIDAWCDRRALAVGGRLRLFLEVCAGVEFAHRQRVLHLDLKADNVLVDDSGRPKLLDFGIARLLGPEPADAERKALGLGEPLTPEWASPEQLRGDPLTPASDVYSLGVLLCALLTGERPHRWTGEAPGLLARRIAAGGGSLPGLLRRGAAPGVERRALRGDLGRILARALSPEVDRRYGSAAELADDLERYLDGRPVSVHPPSILSRLGRLARRRLSSLVAGLHVSL